MPKNETVETDAFILIHSTSELKELGLFFHKDDPRPVDPFLYEKYDSLAHVYWDKFYNRNSDKFFKDRHWLFTELFSDYSRLSKEDKDEIKVFEVGCGVGNAILPLLSSPHFHHIHAHACDFSPKAISLLIEGALRLRVSSRLDAFVCDVTTDDLADKNFLVDVITLIFVLSSVNPDKMCKLLQNLSSKLNPSSNESFLFFRDYAICDYAMKRFAPGHMLAENFFVRQDGTRAFYFSIEYVTRLFVEAGFSVIELYYVQKFTENKKMATRVPRLFIQGKFAKKIK